MDVKTTLKSSTNEWENSCVHGNDIALLENEKFDFDLPISPDFAIANPRLLKSDEVEDDEDEVFFGPVGHKEQCIQAVVEIQQQEAEFKPLSPLNSEQFVELFKEATTVALQIKNSTSSESENKTSDIRQNPSVVKLMQKDVENKENIKCNEGNKEKLNCNENLTRIKNLKERLNALPLSNGLENKVSTDSKGQLQSQTAKTSKLESAYSKSNKNSLVQGKCIPRTMGFASRLPKTHSLGKTKSDFSTPIQSSTDTLSSKETNEVDKKHQETQDKAGSSTRGPSCTPKKSSTSNQLRRSVLPTVTSKSIKEENTAPNEKLASVASKLRPPSQTGLVPPRYTASRHRRSNSATSTSSSSSVSQNVAEKEIKDDKIKSVQQQQPSRPRIKSSLTTFGSCIAKPNIRQSARPTGLAKPLPVKAVSQTARKSDSAAVSQAAVKIPKTPQQPGTPSRRRSGIPLPGSQQTSGVISRPSTPSRTNRDKSSCATPVMSGKDKAVIRSRKSLSASCTKRRSFLPTFSTSQESSPRIRTPSRKLLLSSPKEDVSTKPSLESLDLATPPPENTNEISTVIIKARELLGKEPPSVENKIEKGSESLALTDNNDPKIDLEDKQGTLPVVEKDADVETTRKVDNVNDKVEEINNLSDAASILEMSPAFSDDMIKLEDCAPNQTGLNVVPLDPFSLGKDSPALGKINDMFAVLTPEFKHKTVDLIDLSNTPRDGKACLIDLNDDSAMV